MISYRIWPHYERVGPETYQTGGFVRCPHCGVGRGFVSNGPMAQWQQRHETPGLFGCAALHGTDPRWQS
jgi:hypothetical protein